MLYSQPSRGKGLGFGLGLRFTVWSFGFWVSGFRVKYKEVEVQGLEIGACREDSVGLAHCF